MQHIIVRHLQYLLHILPVKSHGLRRSAAAGPAGRRRPCAPHAAPRAAPPHLLQPDRAQQLLRQLLRRLPLDQDPQVHNQRLGGAWGRGEGKEEEEEGVETRGAATQGSAISDLVAPARAGAAAVTPGVARHGFGAGRLRAGRPARAVNRSNPHIQTHRRAGRTRHQVGDVGSHRGAADVDVHLGRGEGGVRGPGWVMQGCGRASGWRGRPATMDLQMSASHLRRRRRRASWKSCGTCRRGCCPPRWRAPPPQQPERRARCRASTLPSLASR